MPRCTVDEGAVATQQHLAAIAKIVERRNEER